MQKSKKRIFGLVGLTLVGAMLAAAISIPSPNAAAMETDVNVTVTVRESGLSVSFTAPQDGVVVTNPELEVSTAYSKATRIEYFLSYTNSNGQEVHTPIGSFNPADDAGVHNFTVDLRNYTGENNFRLSTIAYGVTGDQREDTVSFQYRVMNATYNGTDAKGDPEIKAEAGSDVNKIQVQVYDKDGNPLFVDENGVEHPIIIGRDQIDDQGQVLITLPFDEYGAKSGDYTTVLVSYDANGNIIAINPVDFPYAEPGTPPVPVDPTNPTDPNAPNVPDTGIALGGLNISRLDYILTGLIAFGAVAGFAIYLICRRNRHDR